MKLSIWQKRVLRILASIAIVVGIFWFIPFHEVVRAFHGLRLEYVAIALVANLISGYLEGVQLWILLKQAKVPTTLWTVMETKMTTRFYGQFLPSELMAAGVKFYRLAEPTRQWGEVVATLVFFRVVNMGTLTLVGLVFWLIEMPEGPGRWIGVILVAMLLLLVFVHLILSSPRLARAAKRLHKTRWLSWLKGRLVDKVKKLTRVTIESYRLFHDSALVVILLAIVRHAVGIVSFWILALSLGISLSFLTIGWIRVVLHAIMNVPITLGGIGVREGSLVLLLKEYGVSGGDAVALAFLLVVLTLVQNSTGGILELRNLLRSESKDPTPPVNAPP